MKIFEQEKSDGLELASNKAFGSIVTPYKIQEISDTDAKDIKPDISLASLKDSSIYFLESILVSTGWNNNDDVFLPKPLWLARATPINKWFNFEHHDDNIIGVITSARAVDLENNPLPDELEEDDIPDDFNISVSSIIYLKWHDNVRTNWISGLIKDIEDNKYGVSMECIFDNFSYAVSNDKEEFIIPREKKSSFLTKHLRRYGGSGEYEGYKIGRAFTEYVFCGKGLTQTPANDKSVIIPFNGSKIAKAHELFKGKQMDKEQELQSKLDAANLQISALQNDVKKANDSLAVSTQENEKLKTDLTGLTVKVTELEKTNTTIVEENKTALASKTNKINELVSELTKNTRLTKLAQAGIVGDEANKLIDKWSTANDEMFDSVLELVKATKVQLKVEQTVETDSNEKLAEAAEIVESKEEVKIVPEVENETVAKATAWLKETLKHKVSK